MIARRHHGLSVTNGAIGLGCFRPVFLLLTAFMMAWASPVSSQDDWFRISSVQGVTSRLVFPDVATICLVKARRILDALEEERNVPGLPADAPLLDPITISLALDMPQGLDARSTLRTATVILPLRRSLGWKEAKLRRVLRHELAHIAIADYLGYRDMPPWFTEGFAEWVSGGLTLEGHARVEIEIQRRSTRIGELLPGLQDAWEDLPKRLAYDFFASFFEFLESRQPFLLRNGDLLRRVRDQGLRTALSTVFGGELGELEAAWHGSLQDQLPPESGLGVASVHDRGSPVAALWPVGSMPRRVK